LVEHGDEAVLTCDFVRASPRGDRLRAELLVTALILTARSSLGVWQPPLAIEFEHEQPEYVAEYARIFECPLNFGRQATRIRVARSLLDVPHIHKNPEVYELLDSQAKRLLSSMESRVTTQVHAILLAEHTGARPEKPTMRFVARRLGVSARSLRRRLQEEGNSYTQVAERAMADVARRLLHSPEATIQEVAHRLGFSEPSAFHRAFKRWTGLTPGQFRERR
jgi:AraC-like DNA-binding protein